MATNHADASGLTSSNPWAGVDGDGATELALAAPSQGQDAVRRLGSPTHVGCCPTGTLEVTSAASKKECGNAIEATVAALTRNLSTTPPRVILGSGGPGLLYLGKRVCRPPGRRSGAREGYMGRSGSLGSSMGSIWATACPRTWPFGGVHVQSGVRKGRGPKDIYSTE